MVWVMLNPSTADADVDDPTIRRCINFAKREGCGSIEVINLYALRTTKPEHLLDHPDPVGPGNRAWWDVVLGRQGLHSVVAAWGAGASELRLPPSTNHGCYHPGWQCLGHTKAGFPRHPLYVKAATPFQRWS
jgi:hypothetical protein